MEEKKDSDAKKVKRVPNPKFRPWWKLVGIPKDLADAVLTVFSLATINFKIDKVRKSDFYRAFASLMDDFEDVIPYFIYHEIHYKGGYYVQSYALSNALEQALSLGIRGDLYNYLYFPNSEEWLERYAKEALGDEWIENFQPVAKRFAELVTSPS